MTTGTLTKTSIGLRGGQAWSGRLRRNQRLRLVDVEGRACVAAHGCSDINPETTITNPGTAPMTNLSWTDAQDYVAWLSAASGVPAGQAAGFAAR